MDRGWPGEAQAALDRRFMAAAIRLAARHSSLTSTNPSVGALIVRDDGAGPTIVGRGVTALGGRPHAETHALAQAGELARGATAYVTLEPCAHHGRTPPCANALVTAGIARLVGAAADPDDRVSGKGYAIVRAAGVAVVEGVLAAEAADRLAGYLIRSLRKRPEVTLKLALSSDGMIGRLHQGQIAITGPAARRQVQMMRADCDAILVGVGTAEADDPELTVRLPGLEARSPARIILDRNARLSPTSQLALSARQTPVYLAVGQDAAAARRRALENLGVRSIATEMVDGGIALPELLEDLAAQGMATLLVEGGAHTARRFLEDDLVDRLALFRGPDAVGADGVASPIDHESVPAQFTLRRTAMFGPDAYREWTRKI